MFCLYRGSLILKNLLNGYLQYYNIKKLDGDKIKFFENLGILYRCPTRYQTRHFFNNFTTDEDIAIKFEAYLPHCVRNVMTS